MSLRRARTQPSCISKVPKKRPWEKESPGPPCPGPTVTRSPVFVARISLLTKVVQRGKTRATKWHEVQFNCVSLEKYSGCNSHLCDGFPSPSQVPPTGAPITGSPYRSPEAPVCPPVAGASLMERYIAPHTEGLACRGCFLKDIGAALREISNGLFQTLSCV
jgi:hypothetical protein